MRKHSVLVVVALTLSACLFRPGSSIDPDSGTAPSDAGHSDVTTSEDASNADAGQLCGNGRLDPGEKCDPCDDFSCPSGGCAVWAQVGSATTCDLECVQNGEQTACGNGDGCCPTGCDESNDDDCSVACGNGQVDPGETCDPCPPQCPQELCAPMNQSGDPSTCDLQCDPEPVPEECCGGEVCDVGEICRTSVDTNAESCVEDECADDNDCLTVGPRAQCVNGTCIVGKMCIDDSDCLPWENCEVGGCETATSCLDAANGEAWCNFMMFDPGQQGLDCYEPAGAQPCVEYQPRFCSSDSECRGYERCTNVAGTGSCMSVDCQCMIAPSCNEAQSPAEYCLFETGDRRSICSSAGCM